MFSGTSNIPCPTFGQDGCDHSDRSPPFVREARRFFAPLMLIGKLRNNCAVAAGAQIKITAEDGKGNVVDTTDGWPASPRNIGPGATYAFDMGPLMTYRKGMKKFSVEVIDVRTWVPR